ncbi:hypothetical protein T492DRAFT_854104 [Pavlovales sp. CCMP2436]|nr:hypothetical protein T492DRAFT_854104 [Pavlovales sp. CCMP2436]
MAGGNADELLRLLQLERAAELADVEKSQADLSHSDLLRLGLGLPRLRVGDVSSGLYGRTLIELVAASGAPLPPHSFHPGSVVAVKAVAAGGGGAASIEGTVYKLSERAVTVAAESCPDDLEEGCAVVLTLGASDATYKRERDALQRLRAPPADAPWSCMAGVARGEAEPRFAGAAAAGGEGVGEDDGATAEADAVEAEAAEAAVANGGEEGAQHGARAKRAHGLHAARKKAAAAGGGAARLNADQRGAIAHSLAALDFALVHGVSAPLTLGFILVLTIP